MNPAPHRGDDIMTTGTGNGNRSEYSTKFRRLFGNIGRFEKTVVLIILAASIFLLLYHFVIGPGAQYKHGLVAIQRGNDKQAITILENIVSKYPDSKWSNLASEKLREIKEKQELYNKGCDLAASGNFEEGIHQLEILHSKYPNTLESNLASQKILRFQGMLNERQFNKYIPLTVGSRWSYRSQVSEDYTNGNHTKAYVSNNIEVWGESTFRGENTIALTVEFGWYVWTNWESRYIKMNDPNALLSQYFEHYKIGFNSISQSTELKDGRTRTECVAGQPVGGSEGAFEILLMTPIEVGTRWDDGLGVGGISEIINTSATVTVPAGKFKECLVVRKTYTHEDKKDDAVELRYYAPGVGLVLEKSDVVIHSQLISYHIANQ